MKIILQFTVLLLLANKALAQQILKPVTTYVKTEIITGKTTSEYVELSRYKPIKVTVEGPGELVIYSRLEVNSDQKYSASGRLKYKIDNKQIKSIKIPKKKLSLRSRIKGNTSTSISKAHKTRIKVPEGKHTFSLYKQNKTQKIYSKYVYVKKKKVAWTEIKNKDTKQVILRDIKNKKKVAYSEISKNDVFTFQTDENTNKIRLFFRANFNYKMLEDCTNRLQVKIDGKLSSFKIVSKKSTRYENISNTNLIPGIQERIYIDLSIKGSHKVEIFLKDPYYKALIRIFQAQYQTSKKLAYENIAYTF